MRLPELLLYLAWVWRMNDQLACPWCGQPFEPRTIGAHRKRFCSSPCKNAYNTALRKWAQRAADHGEVTVTDLKAH